MSALSVRLSRALATGDAVPAPVGTRADLVRALLRARAATTPVGDPLLPWPVDPLG